MYAQNSSRSLTLKIHFNIATSAALSRVWVTSEEQKYSCCSTWVSLSLPQTKFMQQSDTQYYFRHSKLHNSASRKYMIVLKIIRCNKMLFFCEGTNTKINLILKEKNRFSPIPLTPLPGSVSEEVATNTAKLTINLWFACNLAISL